MTRNLVLLEHASVSGVETINLNYQEISNILGLELPKTAQNLRGFWRKSNNRRRVQNQLGLSSRYTCEVKLKERIVIFQKKR
jgi:hypothetical protein